MNRRNQILVGLLVLQLIVLAFVFWPRSAVSGKEGQSLFPGIAADQIVGLAITGADGQSVRLAKGADGWVLPDAGDYPVQVDKVPALLTKIVGLKASQPVATTSSSLKRLKVAKDSFERLIEFQVADGSIHRLYLGSSPSYGANHVRADEQNEVYLARGLSTQDAGNAASDWVDRDYLSIPQDQIVAFTLENGQGRLDLEKNGGQWAMQGLAVGETLDQGKITTLLNRVSPLTLVQPLGKENKPEYGLQQASAVLTIKAQSDAGVKTYTLRVGAPWTDRSQGGQDTADKSYVVISSESPYFVRVSEYAVKDLVEKGKDEFLQLPPTLTPAASATPQS